MQAQPPCLQPHQSFWAAEAAAATATESQWPVCFGSLGPDQQAVQAVANQASHSGLEAGAGDIPAFAHRSTADAP